MKMKFTVLGTRGSVPVEGKDYSIYGGATSCYQVRAGNEEIYLDAGSGIVTAKISANTNISILFSHMHMDHVLGLPFFSALSQKDRSVDMYSEKSSGLDLKSAIDHLIAPPFWPVKIEQYPANVRFHDVQKKFSIGEVEIETMSGNHPGGTTIYRLNYKSKSIVYVTDFEHSSEEKCEELIRFSADCDLLTYDAQYTNEEYNRFRGFGHSTVEFGLKIAEKARVKRILFVHHAPNRTDKDLLQMERAIFDCEGARFAKIGDEFDL